MPQRSARTNKGQVGVTVASLMGIGVGAAIGLTGYDSGASWGYAAAGGLILVASGFALGGALASSARAAAAAVPGPDLSSPALDAAELASTRRELEVTRGELAALHSSLSHGLRSPIGAVINFAAVIEEDYGSALGADGRALLESISRSARSALALADGLARLSAIGRHELALQPIDPEDLVRASFAAVAPPNRSLELRIEHPLPPVMADAELLRTAFDQLLANAVRFTARREKASVSVGGRRDGDSVVYWVEDDGAGFPSRYADKLFRPFERLHRQDEFPGVGVGLAIVRRIAERHGGSVEADAEPDRGARFQLRLPAAPGRPS